VSDGLLEHQVQHAVLQLHFEASLSPSGNSARACGFERFVAFYAEFLLRIARSSPY
jgi:hypothetical protein